MRTHTGRGGLHNFVDLSMEELKILAGKSAVIDWRYLPWPGKEEGGIYAMYLPPLI